jgi:hypothetical protein
LLLVKDALLNARPKLGECILTHETGEPPECSDGGSSVRGVTVGPPGVGKKVVTGRRNIPRVSRHPIAFAIVSHKGHDYHASQAVSKRGIGIPEITRIFAPESAESCLHRVARGDARKPHPIPLGETFPMGPVLLGVVSRSADACAEQTSGKGFWTDGAADEPREALATRDRLIRRRRKWVGGCAIEGLSHGKDTADNKCTHELPSHEVHTDSLKMLRQSLWTSVLERHGVSSLRNFRGSRFV